MSVSEGDTTRGAGYWGEEGCPGHLLWSSVYVCTHMYEGVYTSKWSRAEDLLAHMSMC